ncbi:MULTISPECIES: DDE-type integrase/transposase/recombinase [unclassified Streptomyces]|uniref:DDE-type integrase/transposase/recombinase n=1 Tax=unclassified Streptomyces TaxID=2593676 RepID=UPI003FA3A51C
MTPSTLRRWRRNPLRRRSALSPCLAAWDALRARDKWHLDKVSITINGEQKYLWRAVDQYGNLLDILVQNRRNKASGQALLPSAPPRNRGGDESDRHTPAPLLPDWRRHRGSH